MVANACVWNSKSYRSQVNHDEEHYKATRDTEFDECGGEGRDVTTLRQVGGTPRTSLSLRSQTTRPLYILISSLGLKTPESASVWDRDWR